jgi:beta-phosphoglucomutase
MTIKAILFDMDGVLIDAKEWHYLTLNQSLEEFGLDSISREDHLSTYDGLSTKDKLKIYPPSKLLSTSDHESINARKQELTYRIIEERCAPNLIHVDTLRNLQSEGYKLGCCSNSTRRTVETMLQKANLHGFMVLQLSNEDVIKAKPSPEIYVNAIEKLNLKPNEVLICEDNIRGIEAALGSGAYVLEVSTIDCINYENIKNAIARIQESESPIFSRLLRPPIRKAKLSEMMKGWFVGNFYPSVLISESFEAGVKEYKKGHKEASHVHKLATEITVVATGKVRMCDRIINAGEMILMEPGVSTSFEALEDTITFVVKTPSSPSDKYET